MKKISIIFFLTFFVILNCKQTNTDKNKTRSVSTCDPQSTVSQQLNILGGTKVIDNSWDRVVGVTRVGKQGTMCTGTLIHPQVVLTAAHCLISEESYQKAMDMQDSSYFELDTSGIMIYVGNGSDTGNISAQYNAKKVAVNPKFNIKEWGGDHGSHADLDIAYVLVDRPIENVKIFSILNKTEEQFILKASMDATIIGFGSRNKEGSVGGEKYLATVQFKIDNNRDSIRKQRSEIVLGNEQKTALPGDSGGPAFVQINVDGCGTEWRQVGVVSTSDMDTPWVSYGRPWPSLCWIEKDINITGVKLIKDGIDCNELDLIPLGKPAEYKQGTGNDGNNDSSSSSQNNTVPEIAEMSPRNGAQGVSCSTKEIYAKFNVPMKPIICIATPCQDTGVCYDKAYWKDKYTLAVSIDPQLKTNYTYNLTIGVSDCKMQSETGRTVEPIPWSFSCN